MNALQNGSRFNLLPVGNLAREMNRWFDDVSGPARAHDMVAPVSIWEDDTHYHFEFDMPGILADDVDVKVVDNELHVNARRMISADRKFVRQERGFGEFERKFHLASNIDESSVEAELKLGVLRLTIAKAPESQVKKIEVKSD